MSKSMKLDRRYLEHLAGLLREEIRRRDVSDAAFARSAGIAQSQLSSVLRSDATGRGVGVVVLIALRRELRMSIDEMLGLEPLPARKAAVTVAATELERAVERALARRFPEPAGDPPPLPPMPPLQRKKHS